MEMVSITDVGRVRRNNEDSVAVDAVRGIAVLADGMGGYRAGEVASGMAASDTLSEMKSVLDRHVSFEVDAKTGQSEVQQLLRDCIVRENARIYQAAHDQVKYAGMGTTLVVALFHDARLTVAHLGDSRLYRLRGDGFQRLTRDHSLVQEQIDLGMITPEQARLSTNRNLVTRALGLEAAVEPEIHSYSTLPDDLYLLCSDGLSDMVDDEDIGALLHSSGVNLEVCARQLVQMANDHGGRDNVSVILVRMSRKSTRTHSFKGMLLNWLK